MIVNNYTISTRLLLLLPLLLFTITITSTLTITTTIIGIVNNYAIVYDIV